VSRRDWLVFAFGASLVLFGAVLFEYWEDSPDRPWAVL